MEENKKNNSAPPLTIVRKWWELKGEELEKFIFNSRWDLKLEDRQYGKHD